MGATNYGRAFGRVIYVEDGKEHADWGPAAPLTLYVQSNASGQIQPLNVESQGAFFWPLQAGEYLVVGYVAVTVGGSSRRLSGRLWATFSVPRPREAVYVGDVRIEQRGLHSRVSILDKYSEAAKKEEGRITAASLQVSKGLMRQEVAPTNYRWIVDVCSSALWGLECGRFTRGVEPLEPHGTGTGTGFSVTQDLLPVLRWKASSRAGITYDIEIYESLSFPQTEFGNPRWLRGARIVHEEGLSEPRYTPASPLKPGMRYEWTVRLRNGDTVSTWSTGGSVGWFAVDIRSGSYFVFFTPER